MSGQRQVETIPNGKRPAYGLPTGWFDEFGIKSSRDMDEFLDEDQDQGEGPSWMSRGRFATTIRLDRSCGPRVPVMDKDGRRSHSYERDGARRRFVRKLYKGACIEDCVGWLDRTTTRPS